MRKLGQKLINLTYNIYSFFAGIILGRSKKNIVIGSWGGAMFSDNSRFLYQYLCANKSSFGLSNVVWATRDAKINSKLNSIGYKSCLIGTKESKKWHLKSKIHIICNMYTDIMNFRSDIDTKYSCGARKIQLWHGAGIKACGYLSNDGKKTPAWKKKISNSFLFALFTRGCWKRSYFVAIGEENKRVAIYDYGYKPNKVIVGIYPRLCYSPKLFDDEIAIVNKIEQIRLKGKAILFLPTFRKDTSNYLPPEKINGFVTWLEKNNFFWIKKNHSVDADLSLDSPLSSNIMILPNNFDINILYDHIDMVITDYSSASTDAIFKNLHTLEYCPDYDYYEQNDRGFVNDFSKYHVFNPVIDPSTLFGEIERRFRLDLINDSEHNETRDFLFGKNQISMKKLSEIIIGIKPKKEGEKE